MVRDLSSQEVMRRLAFVADYATAPAAKLAPKPANLSFEQAAAVGISGLTAAHRLSKLSRSVAVLGASNDPSRIGGRPIRMHDVDLRWVSAIQPLLQLIQPSAIDKISGSKRKRTARMGSSNLIAASTSRKLPNVS